MSNRLILWRLNSFVWKNRSAGQNHYSCGLSELGILAIRSDPVSSFRGRQALQSSASTSTASEATRDYGSSQCRCVRSWTHRPGCQGIRRLASFLLPQAAMSASRCHHRQAETEYHIEGYEGPLTHQKPWPNANQKQ
ncbi:Uncharacterized protein HZ326_17408 [Fusarium oxysporum f. sp. albedinis]|nr:Uncharacterized protein HZ326_17408 [Fusarium oxysporum f. sp. albedinis]